MINVNSTPQELTSPNYPDNYPTNVHCKWVLHKQLWATFDLHIVDVDIEPSDTCSNDRLQIRELEVNMIFFFLFVFIISDLFNLLILSLGFNFKRLK